MYYYFNSKKCHWNNFKVCVTSWVPMPQISHQNLYTSASFYSEISGETYVWNCATSTQFITRVQIIFDFYQWSRHSYVCIVYTLAFHFIFCWKLSISNVDGWRNQLYDLWQLRLSHKTLSKQRTICISNKYDVQHPCLGNYTTWINFVPFSRKS